MKYPQSELGRVALYFLLGFIAFAIASHISWLESQLY